MLNPNRHQWTPPKWLGSSAGSPSDGSPPTIRRHFLWTSGDGATMRNESWVWPQVGMPGRATTTITTTTTTRWNNYKQGTSFTKLMTSLVMIWWGLFQGRRSCGTIIQPSSLNLAADEVEFVTSLSAVVTLTSLKRPVVQDSLQSIPV